jgi:tyrosyl-tRNA synthetase
MVKINAAKIEEALTRSIDTIYPDKKSLENVLKSGKKLRIYVGIDPTATYLHLGHSTNYIILKRFHELGHKIIVLIGDFTAMIGDPSDKNAARKRLTKKEVLQNLKTFKQQIGKILNFSDKKNPVELRFNSKWLARLNFKDVVDLASNFTVQRMLERDIFEKRIKENKPLYLHEFFYPLMQGYDSVALNADVELGGTDQTFNMLAGRNLVKTYQNREKFVITSTLLENPVTGEKLMSKSLGTGIALNDAPNEMFGKTMALPDEAIIQCFIDCTYLSMDEIHKMETDLKNGINPRNLKLKLAYEITKMYHSEFIAKKAQEYFIKTFSKKEMPSEDEVPEIKVKSQNIVDILVETGLVSSKSEAKRLILQKGVSLNHKIIDNWKEIVKINKNDVLKVGSRKFVRLKLK